jgi:hypothetical protein
MSSFYLSPSSLLILSGCICLVWSTWWLLEKNENGISRLRQSKSTLLFLLLPGLINLAAFYSLALHMYLSLGDWPGIGTDGFPEALLLHNKLVSYLFTISLFFPLILFGPLWILFYLIKPLKPWLDKLAAFGISCVVSALLTQLAPSGFLYWFWD